MFLLSFCGGEIPPDPSPVGTPVDPEELDPPVSGAVAAGDTVSVPVWDVPDGTVLDYRLDDVSQGAVTAYSGRADVQVSNTVTAGIHTITLIEHNTEVKGRMVIAVTNAGPSGPP
jgi:hypothetical protein